MVSREVWQQLGSEWMLEQYGAWVRQRPEIYVNWYSKSAFCLPTPSKEVIRLTDELGVFIGTSINSLEHQHKETTLVKVWRENQVKRELLIKIFVYRLNLVPAGKELGIGETKARTLYSSAISYIDGMLEAYYILNKNQRLAYIDRIENAA